jgi:hypothetical protein
MLLRAADQFTSTPTYTGDKKDKNEEGGRAAVTAFC